MGAIVLGIDFDNTLVSYEGVFYRAAVEAGLIGGEVGTSKDSVKAHLIAAGREDDWTTLQGEVYGARMDLAKLFDGAADAMKELVSRGAALRIISHKTRHPFRGPKYDLHAAARDFLVRSGIAGGLVPPEHTFFELTIAEKISRISVEGCTHFLDDLVDVLGNADFPRGISRILFDPSGSNRTPQFECITAWRELPARVHGA
jgi:hypothetical protein